MQLTPHQPITIPSINLQPRTSTFDWYVYRGQVNHAKETRITSCRTQRRRRLGRQERWATRSSGHFDKKQEAVDAGRKISQNQGTEFYIHGKDGKIQNKDSHGNDPYPPKG